MSFVAALRASILEILFIVMKNTADFMCTRACLIELVDNQITKTDVITSWEAKYFEQETIQRRFDFIKEHNEENRYHLLCFMPGRMCRDLTRSHDSTVLIKSHVRSLLTDIVTWECAENKSAVMFENSTPILK